MAQAAEIAEDWKAELAATRELVKAERVAAITEEMRFTAEESEAFWPLYEEYHRDMLVVQDRHVQLVADFVGKYYDYKLTDADAKLMQSRSSPIISLSRKTCGIFKKAMSASLTK